MKTTSDKIAVLIGRLIALAILYTLIGFMASLTIDTFHPHDYPLYGFILAVATIDLLVKLLTPGGKRPTKLSASDNR